MPQLPKAFQQFLVSLPTADIVPQAPALGERRKSTFARQIAASIKEIGLIEPLVVYPRAAHEYLLLDGHVRLEILKEMGATEVRCLLATDDEAYTYNRRVNAIPPVAQHLMLLEALRNGLTEERVAGSRYFGDPAQARHVKRNMRRSCGAVEGPQAKCKRIRFNEEDEALATGRSRGTHDSQFDL